MISGRLQKGTVSEAILGAILGPKWDPNGSDKGRAGTKRLQEGIKTLEKSKKERHAKTLVNNSKNGPWRVRLVLAWPLFGRPLGLKRVQDDHKKHIKKGIQNGTQKLIQNGSKMGAQNPIKTSQEASNKGSFLGLVLGTPQERPKRGPREAQEGPRGRPERPRRAQEEPKRSPRRPKRRPGDPKRATRDFQESPTKPKRCRRPPQRV